MACFRYQTERVPFFHSLLGALGVPFPEYYRSRCRVGPVCREAMGPAETGPKTCGVRFTAFQRGHSEGTVLLAASRHRVGVDVETSRELPDVDRLIEHTLTTDAAELVLREGESQYSQAFLRFWTRKEAFLKGIGVGFSVDPASADVALPEAPILRTSVPGPARQAATRWRIVTLYPMAEPVGALAMQRLDARLHRFGKPHAGTPPPVPESSWFSLPLCPA